MIDPFTKTRFHSDLKLETWHPEGVLDGPMAARMIHQLAFKERMAEEPFNRFIDLTKLTAIRLDFIDLIGITADRRAATEGQHPVKSAYLAMSLAAYGVAHMFAVLMEPSPIEVQVFRKVEDAAQWLGVPVEALRAEP